MDILDLLCFGSSPRPARATYKQTLAALLVLGVVVGLVACGGPAATPTPAALVWTQKADMQPSGRFGFVTAMVNGNVYVMGGIGGPTTVHVYEPATDTWTQKASMLHETVFSSASAVNGRIYVIGGNSSDSGDSHAFVEEYDPVTDTWIEKASMPTHRGALFTSVVDGKIYAIGGTQWEAETNRGSNVAAVEEYDPATDTWTQKTSLATSRCLAGAVTVNGKIYVVGGQTDPTVGVLSSVVEYDPVADTWTEKTPMPGRRTWGGAVVHNSRIYVFGGAENYQGPARGTVFVYDPTTDTWAQREDLPFERWGWSAETVGDKVYLIGGSTEPRPWQPYLPEVWECDLGAAD
jgi:N-acetylneuraminic acid mutarotase